MNDPREYLALPAVRAAMDALIAEIHAAAEQDGWTLVAAGIAVCVEGYVDGAPAQIAQGTVWGNDDPDLLDFLAAAIVRDGDGTIDSALADIARDQGRIQ